MSNQFQVLIPAPRNRNRKRNRRRARKPRKERSLMQLPISFLTVTIAIVVIYLLSSIKILAEYERGVIFRIGHLLPQAKGPGIILVFAPIDRLVGISLRLITMEVPAQETITRDQVT